MSKQNKIKKVVLREDLLAITGDYRKAIILNQFIYWSERVSDADKFIEQENEIAKKNNETERDLFYGWIYKTSTELADEIMLGISSSQVGRYVKELCDCGFLSKRNNPKYKWDRTLQYRVNLVNIAIALREKGYPLSDYKIDISALESPNLCIPHPCNMDNEPMQYQNCVSNETIPDITVNNTNKNNSLNRTSSSSDTDFDSAIMQKVTELTDDETIINGISYYLDTYKRKIGKYHPDVSKSALDNIIYTINVVLQDVWEDVESENGLVRMIDRHFRTDYGMQIDYNIVHFGSEGIIEKQARNVGLITGMMD